MNSNLTIRQSKALQALLSGDNVTACAKAGGVTRTTFYKWLAQPTFKAALNQADGEIIETLTRRLTSLGNLALNNLEAVLSDPKTPPGVRMRAAVEVVNCIIRLRELYTLENRLADLEAAPHGNH